MARLVLMLKFAVAVLTMASPAVGGKSQGDVTTALPTDAGKSQGDVTAASLADSGKSLDDGKKENKEVKNILISNYIIEFEEIRQQCSDNKLKEAMSVMKLLVMQRWIVTLEPGMNLLKDIMPPNGLGTLDEVNKEIIKDLKERNTLSPVADAMKLYFENKEGEVQEHFGTKKATLTVEREKILKEVYRINVKNVQANVNVQLTGKTKKLLQATFNNWFHSLARTMAEHAYTNIFD